jgi:hypothetical protein
MDESRALPVARKRNQFVLKAWNNNRVFCLEIKTEVSSCGLRIHGCRYLFRTLFQAIRLIFGHKSMGGAFERTEP